MASSDETPRPPDAASSERIAHSAGLAGIATLTSRVLGVARETVLAAYFGAGNDYDAYLVAFRIPNLMRDLFAEGAMSAAFVPTFTRHLTLHGKPAAWRLGNNVINALLVVIGVRWSRPGYSPRLWSAGLPPTSPRCLASWRSRSCSLDHGAVPHARRHRGSRHGNAQLAAALRCPALSPAMFNVASILCTIALVPVMPWLGWPRIVAPAVA